jgi:hypothetical protein
MVNHHFLFCVVVMRAGEALQTPILAVLLGKLIFITFDA